MVVATSPARAARRRVVPSALTLAPVVLAAACLPGWRQQAAIEGVFLEDIACSDAQHCWAVGRDAAGAVILATITNALGDFEIGPYAYVSPPVITRIRPTSGTPGTTVWIEGEHLPVWSDPRAVWFGDERIDDATCDDRGCFASAPAGTGSVPVRIETGGGVSAVTPEAMFTYL